MTASRARGAAALLALLAAACRAHERRWPFPEVASADDAAVAAALRARTAAVRSLYAELSMSFESRERAGVFGAAVHYDRGRIRMTGFKDVLVSSRGVFDLLLTPERYVLVLEGENGPERHEGPAGDLSRVHPGFRALAALREAMFLPGLVAGNRPPAIRREGGKIIARGPAPSGAEVEWILEPRTLGVEVGRILFAGEREPAAVAFRSYRTEGGAFIPESFALEDPVAGVAIEGVLDDLELNASLAESVFDPAAIGGARGP